MHYQRIPKDIVGGLNIKIENRKLVLSQKKLDCIKTKLDADNYVENGNGYVFKNIKAENRFVGDISLYGSLVSNETPVPTILFKPTQPLTWMATSETWDWNEDREREVYDYILNVYFPEDLQDELGDNPTPDQFRERVVSDGWIDVLERISGGPVSRDIQNSIINIIKSCKDENLRTGSKLNALNVAAEKGLPPLSLEKYLGVSEPKKGSQDMKEYYKKYGEVQRKTTEKEEAEQSADAISAMKAGRKTRRQKKATRSKKLHTRNRRR